MSLLHWRCNKAADPHCLLLDSKGWWNSNMVNWKGSSLAKKKKRLKKEKGLKKDVVS